jgi:peptidoglycan/xylan/chitin deacetylase (PgdA/CDA1 family)
MSFRHAVLAIAKLLGGFALARVLTAKGLRILCYHGISLQDEHCFQPKLFMQEDIFRQRMAHLKRHGYPVLPLSDALTLMYQESLPPRALVITFDDGWHGIGLKAVPVLRECGFPSTVYVTTQDVLEEAPVFSVALRYLLWKGGGKPLNMGLLDLGADTVTLDSAETREQVAQRIGEAGISKDTRDQLTLLKKLAEVLEADWNPGDSRGFFRLMTMEQLEALPKQGMDLQLHTHRHRLPVGDPVAMQSELLENRAVLERITAGALQHFCYPSGEFHPSQFSSLRALGIESATTCLSGFNYANTPRLELRRFLDGANIAQVEFEAEVSGFLELMRRVRARIHPRRGRTTGA